MSWWTVGGIGFLALAICAIFASVFGIYRLARGKGEGAIDELLHSGDLNPNSSNVPNSYSLNVISQVGIGSDIHLVLDTPSVQLKKYENSLTTTKIELDNIDR
jgi:hypothetical protein